MALALFGLAAVLILGTVGVVLAVALPVLCLTEYRWPPARRWRHHRKLKENT